MAPFSWELKEAKDATVRARIQAWRIATTTVHRSLLASSLFVGWAVFALNDGWNARIVLCGLTGAVGVTVATIAKLLMENQGAAWEGENERRVNDALRGQL